MSEDRACQRGRLCLPDVGREKVLLQNILETYPLIPTSYHRLSKKTEAPETNDGQALLVEALAAQKQESKRVFQGLWTRRLREQMSPHGYVLTLNATEAECLLQIVNEIRVGSWIKVGSPGLTLGGNRRSPWRR